MRFQETSSSPLVLLMYMCFNYTTPTIFPPVFFTSRGAQQLLLFSISFVMRGMNFVLLIRRTPHYLLADDSGYMPLSSRWKSVSCFVFRMMKNFKHILCLVPFGCPPYEPQFFPNSFCNHVFFSSRIFHSCCPWQPGV